MKKNIKDMKRKGFTLVELIVVIAIIAILAALSVPRVQKFVDDARETRRDADFRAVYVGAHAAYTSWIADDPSNGFPVGSATTTVVGTATTGLDAEVADVLPLGAKIVAGELSAGAAGAASTVGTDDEKADTWTIHYTSDDKGKLTGIYIGNGGYMSTNGEKPQ